MVVAVRLRTTPCQLCGSPMLWARVRKLDGRLRTLPVDPQSDPKGSLEYVAGSADRPLLRELPDDELHGEPQAERYWPHNRAGGCAPVGIVRAPRPERRRRHRRGRGRR